MSASPTCCNRGNSASYELRPPHPYGGAVSYGDVTSANVVGYQLIAVPSGFSLFAPTFKGVGDQRIDLSTIDICNEDGSINLDIYGSVSIQKMDDEGGYLLSYGYDKDSNPDTGWGSAQGDIKVGDVTFGVGGSMCVDNRSGETVYFRVNGEVDLKNLNEVVAGFVLWGNSTPVEIDLKDVNVTDFEGNINYDVYGSVSIQKMDDEGGYLLSYGYDKDSNPDTGWGSASGDLVPNEFVLQPGEACCVDNRLGETVYFKIPCPIKK